MQPWPKGDPLEGLEVCLAWLAGHHHTSKETERGFIFNIEPESMDAQILLITLPSDSTA